MITAKEATELTKANKKSTEHIFNTISVMANAGLNYISIEIKKIADLDHTFSELIKAGFVPVTDGTYLTVNW